MDIKIPPCEYCGNTHYYVKGQARGKVIGYLFDTRKIQEDFTDKMYFEYSTVVRCDTCNKINRNLYYDTAIGLLRIKGS